MRSPLLPVLLSLLPSTLATCPLPGAVFPPPTALANSTTIATALANLTSILTSGLSTGNSSHGPVDPSCAYAVQIVSLDASSPLLEYYHDGTILNETGVTKIDGDSVFRMGSVSKLVTVYMLLAEVGDGYWDTAITDVIPELRNRTGDGGDELNNARWEDITLGALAGQVAGIPRDVINLDFGLPLSKTTPLSALGLPPLPDSENPLCIIDPVTGDTCDRAQFFAALQTRQPVYLPNTKPIYSNTAFVILGYALETLTGRSYIDILASMSEKLGLTATTQTKPDDGRGVIPYNVSASTWAVPFGESAPAGALYTSANDLSLLALSILNSTLLSKNTTRAWLQPTSLTSDLVSAVGRPWEIYRADNVPSRGVIDIYTKGGDIGLYHTFFAVVPDYNVGVVAIVGGPGDHTWIDASVVDVLFPALEDVAREEAHDAFAGTYRATNGLNSSIELSTSPFLPGLGISSFISNGTDMLASFSLIASTTFGPDALRMYPTNLEEDNADGTKEVSWRISFDVPGHRQETGPFSACGNWFAVDLLAYGRHGIDQVQFTLGKDGRATSVSPVAFMVELERVEGGD